MKNHGNASRKGMRQKREKARREGIELAAMRRWVQQELNDHNIGGDIARQLFTLYHRKHIGKPLNQRPTDKALTAEARAVHHEVLGLLRAKKLETQRVNSWLAELGTGQGDRREGDRER